MTRNTTIPEKHRPIETFRRLRALLLIDTPRMADVYGVLGAVPAILYRACDLESGSTALRRLHLDLLIADPHSPAAAPLMARPHRQHKSLPILLIEPPGAGSGIASAIAGKPHRIAADPADPRCLCADMLALVYGLEQPDVTPHDIDAALSYIPGLNLIFWHGRLLRLHRLERTILCTLASAPGQLFTWGELAGITHHPIRGLYNALNRLRLALTAHSGGRNYIDTIHGKGIKLRPP